MLVLILTVAIFLTRGCYGYCDRPDGGCCYPQVPEPDNPKECPRLDFWQDGAVGWDVETSGRLNISFALPRLNCHRITCFCLLLLVDETLSEDECLASQARSIPIEKEFKHSRKQYTINNGCLPENNVYPKCESTGTASFNYVFSGCYQVAFQPKANTSTFMSVYSRREYLHTNYTKNIIAGPRHVNLPWINITPPQYYAAAKKLAITFPVDSLSRRYRMHLNKERKLTLECNDTARECSPIPPKDPPKYPPAQCTVSNGSISCSFSEVAPGEYCLTMHVLVDDRCESDTLWTKPRTDLDCPQENRACSLTCSWQHNFTAEGRGPVVSMPVDNEPDNTNFYVILATVLAVLVIVTIAFLLVLKAYAKRLYQRTPSAGVPSTAIPLEPCRIFLLYARDCHPFMELMATLREVLESATKSEVIDCLDGSRWNDIGRSPVEWVRSHIEHPNTKVILVATPCGHLRQQSHLNQTIAYYKKPEAYDNLFTYGLKTLTDNLSEDIYRKICVVRFEGFSNDGNLFSHLTPYTRFVLPLHLHQLIYTLQPSVTADDEAPHLVVEGKDVQKLSQDLTNLINYKNTNVNYLQDMLIVQRNNVVN